MEKSKLGISVCLLSALTFLTGSLGITVMVLVGGYILIREDNKTLKKSAVNTIVLYLAFAVLTLCIGALDNLIDVFNFNGWMYGSSVYSVITAILSTLSYIVSLAEKVIFGLLAVFALVGKEVKLPVIDKFVEKHF